MGGAERPDDSSGPGRFTGQQIVGRWRTEGRVIGADEMRIVGEDSYDLLAGGHFLVHHIDVTVGARPVRGIEIIGEVDESGAIIARGYDANGDVEIMKVRIDDDGVWHFTGGPEVAPAARTTEAPAGGAVRSTLRFDPDGQGMTALWERADDGMTWEPWMDVRFTRVS